MRAMKKSLTIAILAAGLAVPAVSHADALVGGQLQVLTGGEVDGEAGYDGDLDTAFAIAAIAEWPVHPNFTIGLAPRVAFGIKLEDQDDGGIMLDIPLRGTGRYLVTPKVALYGFVSAGYSLIFPEEWPDRFSDPKGFIFGFGGGAAFAVSPSIAVVGELGYTIGSHGGTIDVPLLDDEDYEAGHSYPHIGIGVQTRM
jgi:hypothetical protein